MLKHNNPIWSADSEWIYFVSGSEPQDEIGMDVYRLRPSGGLPEQLTRQATSVNLLAMLDPRTLLYVARDEDRSGPWLWALGVGRRSWWPRAFTGLPTPYRLPMGVGQFTSVASSRDGRRVVATVANPTASLWRVPLLLDRQADERDVQPYPLPTALALAPRFGASSSSLFYLSASGTSDGLWKVVDGQPAEVYASVDGAVSEPPAVSRDGHRVVAVVRQRGKRHLWIMSADGTDARPLAPSIEIDGVAGQSAADWSPDGKWIVTGGRDAKSSALFKIPVDGGDYAPIIKGNWVNPVWSPKNDLIVYAGRSIVGQVDLQGVTSDGSGVILPHVQVRPGGYRFLPNGNLVYLPRIQGRDFWLLDLVTGKPPRQLTSLSNQGALRTFDISPDGTHIVFDRSRQNSDIVLFDLAK